MLEQYISLYPITKGFSSDEKYVAQYGDEQVLVRLFEEKFQDKKHQEFELLHELERLGAKTIRAIEIGDGYMVTSFIEGEDAEDVIASLSIEEQYAVGRDASQDLRKIHSIRATSNEWYDYQLAKYERYVKLYNGFQLKVPHDTQIIRFIEQRLPLMKDRPSVLQHDDFHLSNLIISHRKYAGAIDFGRFDWGDPVFDFIKLGMFSSEKSIPFAIGLIEGYYDGEPPELFWELYAMYLAMNVFAGIVWGHQLNDNGNMQRHVTRFIDDHEGFTTTIPKWYRRS